MLYLSKIGRAPPDNDTLNFKLLQETCIAKFSILDSCLKRRHLNSCTRNMRMSFHVIMFSLVLGRGSLKVFFSWQTFLTRVRF